MQAQAQTRIRTGGAASRVNPAVAWILAIHIAMHAMWLTLPLLTDGDEVGLAQYIVNGVTLSIGLVGLAGIWKGYRWGWWTMLILTMLFVLFTLPEVFFLEGIMRAASILALLGIVTIGVLLFRPGVRAAK